MEEISDEMFVKEMRILWQNLSVQKRNKLGDLIRDYFNQGERTEKIIFKMQCKI